MKQRTIFFILFCSVYHFGFTQSGTDKTIDTIKFEGLKRTKPSFLFSFLETAEGTIPVDSLLEKDVQRLKNIPSIGDASFRMDSANNQVNIIFKVEEVHTLLPIVNFGGIKDNFWFQLGMSDINWNGKGQFLYAYYQNTDRRHSGEIYFRAPFFRGSFWGFSTNLTKWASREPLYFEEGAVNFDYDVYSAGFTIIRHFDLNRHLEIGGTYFVEKYKKSETQFIENPPGPDALTTPKLLAKYKYSVDLLQYHFHYLRGRSWRLLLQNIYNIEDKNWFHTIQFQGRQFYRIQEKGNLAIRLRLAISSNTDTPFAPFVADSQVNLRGIGNRIDRGTAQIILNTEYRHTVFESKQWASQIVLFSDIGTWRNPGGALSQLFDPDQFRQFVGGGFRIIYQKIYGAVIRVDYGVDVFNAKQQGIVLGLGQYF